MVGDIIDIIRQCADGDGRAWKVFVKEYLPVAKNIIAGSFDLPSEVQDDIIQNVFLKLIRGGLEHFRGTSKYGFLKYFKTIVINETRSYLTPKKDAEKTVSLNDTLQGDPDSERQEALALEDTIQDTRRDSRPDTVIEDRDLLEKVMEIIKDNPLTDKQIFLMKVKGYKDQEIAEILQVPMGTVASSFSRMKARIMDKLK